MDSEHAADSASIAYKKADKAVNAFGESASRAHDIAAKAAEKARKIIDDNTESMEALRQETLAFNEAASAIQPISAVVPGGAGGGLAERSRRFGDVESQIRAGGGALGAFGGGEAEGVTRLVAELLAVNEAAGLMRVTLPELAAQMGFANVSALTLAVGVGLAAGAVGALVIGFKLLQDAAKRREEQAREELERIDNEINLRREAGELTTEEVNALIEARTEERDQALEIATAQQSLLKQRERELDLFGFLGDAAGIADGDLEAMRDTIAENSDVARDAKADIDTYNAAIEDGTAATNDASQAERELAQTRLDFAQRETEAIVALAKERDTITREELDARIAQADAELAAIEIGKQHAETLGDEGAAVLEVLEARRIEVQQYRDLLPVIGALADANTARAESAQDAVNWANWMIARETQFRDQSVEQIEDRIEAANIEKAVIQEQLAILEPLADTSAEAAAAVEQLTNRFIQLDREASHLASTALDEARIAEAAEAASDAWDDYFDTLAELTDEEVALRDQNAEKIAQADRQREEKLTDARINAARKEGDAFLKFLEAESDALADFIDAQGEAFTDLQRDLEDIETDAARERRDALLEARRAEIEAAIVHRERLADIQTQLHDDLEDAELRRDAVSAVRAIRQARRSARDAGRDFDRDRDRRKEDFENQKEDLATHLEDAQEDRLDDYADQLSDLDDNFDKSRAKRLQAFQRRLRDQQTQFDRQMTDLRRQWGREDSERQRQFNDELTDLRNQRMAVRMELQNTLTSQRTLLTGAWADRINDTILFSGLLTNKFRDWWTGMLAVIPGGTGGGAVGAPMLPTLAGLADVAGFAGGGDLAFGQVGRVGEQGPENVMFLRDRVRIFRSGQSPGGGAMRVDLNIGGITVGATGASARQLTDEILAKVGSRVGPELLRILTAYKESS